jgi:hypothetical protein
MGTDPYVIIAAVGQQGPPGPAGGIAAITVTTGSPFTAPAVAGSSIFTVYNTSGSPFQFNLPATPAFNQVVQVIDAGLTANTEAFTISGNGNNVCAYGVSASSAEIVSKGGSISLAWDSIQWTQNG